MSNLSSVQNLLILLLTIIISWLFTHPNKIIEINAKIAVILAPYINSVEKDAVKLTVESSIFNISNNMNKEIEGILPYGVEIEWVSNINRESFIRNNNVVIRLEYHNNNARNIVHATLKYLEEGLLVNVKKIINNDISISIDYITAKKTLKDNNKYESVEYLIEEIINPVENENENIKHNLRKLNDIEDYGIYTRIFLNELIKVNRKYYDVSEDKNITKEISDFIDNLYNIANKEKGIDIDPDYYSDNIQTSIVFIARFETIKKGIHPFITYITSQISIDRNNFYLLARGKSNILVTKTIANHLERNKILTKVSESQYKTNFKGRKYELICINMITPEETQ